MKQMSLADLAQAPTLLKSIVESMDAEMRDAAQLQTEISDFAERIASSERAMTSLQKIHRAVCMTTPPVKRQTTQ